MNSVRRLLLPMSFVLSIVLVASGCVHIEPMYNVENHPIVQHPKPLSLKQIETQIRKAGHFRRWLIRPIKTGLLEGKINFRESSAVIRIEFDQRSFSIRHASSENLLAGKGALGGNYPGRPVIHHAYNKMIRDLETAIDHELTFPN